jgi:hypothetical protein
VGGRPWSALEAEDGERLGRWMAGWATEAAPDGEAFPDVAARAAAWLADLRAGPAPGAPVLVVAHSGSIRALLCELMGWPLAAAFRVRVDHARATRRAGRAGGRRARLRAAVPQRRPGCRAAREPPRRAVPCRPARGGRGRVGHGRRVGGAGAAARAQAPGVSAADGLGRAVRLAPPRAAS